MNASSMPRLLLVDDEPNVIEGLSRRLRREYEILSASDGVAALELLEREAPIPLIISDMRMPRMNGAAFLAEARKRYPQSIRMLLTGQADLESAISAVNDGQIFRFLVKPCPLDVLIGALTAGLRQLELVNAERVLLDQTLRGALKALGDVLALAMPEAFGKAQRIKELAHLVAQALELPDAWRIEAAATLSQIGAVSLSPEVATKLYQGQRLSPDEQTAADRVPSVTVDVLKTIPRLEAVCELIAAAFGKDSESARARHPQAQVLRLCVEHDALRGQGLSPAAAVAKQKERSSSVDAKSFEAFSECVLRDSAEEKLVEVAFLELRPGMVLAEDVFTASGTLLLARGHCIQTNVLGRLRGLSQSVGGRKSVRVRVPGGV